MESHLLLWSCQNVLRTFPLIPAQRRGSFARRIIRSSLRTLTNCVSPREAEVNEPFLETLELPKTELDTCGPAQGEDLKWISAPELIRSEGYPVSEHEVVTPDGYILSLFRIPAQTQTATPVLIQHGLYNSCRDWLAPVGKDPLPYQLHDAGFDVWLASNRGTTYSKHVKYTPKDPQFWSYTNKDIALLDHPTVFDYISEETRKPFVCVAYSWSGYTLMNALAVRTEYNSKVLRFIGIAPYICSDHVSSPAKFLARPDIVKVLRWTLSKTSLTKNGRFVPEKTRPLLQKLYLDMINSKSQVKQRAFEKYLALTVGVSAEGCCMKTVGRALYEFPNDASVNCVLELLENMARPKFYSSYLSDTYGAPSSDLDSRVDLSKVTVPKTFYIMENDTLVTVKDGRQLVQLCGPNAKGYIVKGFNHTDALYGSGVGKLNAEIVSHLKASIEESLDN